MTIYSLDVLLSRFGTNLLFHVQFQLLLPDLIQIFQEASQVVWYSHLIKNIPVCCDEQVKGFSIVSKAEVDFFLIPLLFL